MFRQILLLYNPCAGRRQVGRHLQEIRETLEKAGFDVEIYKTKARGDATRKLARDAAQYDRVVCAGGDGTLNEVISGVLESGHRLPVGYIPAGSTNDFAASLGLSCNIPQAARDVVEGNPISLDIGSFNGRTFVYTASFGAFTRASYAAPQSVKNVLGHMAYLIEGMKDVAHIRPLEMEFCADGENFGGEYIFGAISNSTSMGGVLKLDPSRVDLTDGKLELLLIKATSNLAQLVSVAAALRARNYEHEGIFFRSFRNLEILAKDTFPWTVDGEFEPAADKIHIENLHGAVDLIVPN